MSGTVVLIVLLVKETPFLERAIPCAPVSESVYFKVAALAPLSVP